MAKITVKNKTYDVSVGDTFVINEYKPYGDYSITYNNVDGTGVVCKIVNNPTATSTRLKVVNVYKSVPIKVKEAVKPKSTETEDTKKLAKMKKADLIKYAKDKLDLDIPNSLTKKMILEKIGEEILNK